MKMLRERECFEATGLSRSSRWRLETAGKFPQRRQLSERCVAWIASEVDVWLSSRAAGINSNLAPKRSNTEGVSR